MSKKYTLSGIIAEYLVAGAGAVTGLAAKNSPKVLKGLEQIITFNYDKIGETVLEIVKTAPSVINETTICGMIGLGGAKVIGDFGVYLAEKSETETEWDKLNVKVGAWGLNYIGIAAGIMYSLYSTTSQRIIEFTVDCIKDSRAYSMWLGVAGFTALYHLLTKPTFRFIAKIGGYLNYLFRGDKNLPDVPQKK